MPPGAGSTWTVSLWEHKGKSPRARDRLVSVVDRGTQEGMSARDPLQRPHGSEGVLANLEVRTLRYSKPPPLK